MILGRQCTVLTVVNVVEREFYSRKSSTWEEELLSEFHEYPEFERKH